MKKTFLLLIFMFSAVAHAQTLTLDTLKTALQAPLQSGDALHGHFVQQRWLKQMSKPVQSEGEFTLVPDKLLLWQMEKPFPLTLRVREDGVAQRDAQGKWQPGAQNSRQMALFMAVLGGDLPTLEKTFALTLTGSIDNWQLQLTPKDTLLQHIFTRITLHGDTFVREVVLEETQGDRSVLRFIDTKAITPLPPSAEEALSP